MEEGVGVRVGSAVVEEAGEAKGMEGNILYMLMVVGIGKLMGEGLLYVRWVRAFVGR
jgi:hypothetical protein